MIRIGYKRCEYDYCVYVKSLDDDSSFIFLLLYVDDMLIAAESMVVVNKLKSLLSKEFDMKDLGAAKNILGMEIHRIELQRDYDDEVKDMSKVPYASAVGCLMYAMVCTRPDLAHAISVTMASCSTNNRVILKLDDMLMQTMQVTLMAGAEAAKESLWLTGLVKELGIQQGGVQLYCDSQSAIYLAKNQVHHAKTKHIDVRFHKIRELVSSGKLLLEKVHTSKNAADMLIKPVTT
ncbi:Retrovirus-related Pol polyprotein from transposon TNT 1-94 [Vitis vinifera]|uniref:Retrovirus-related Pol polyprotein from transposon TNT 1-94 n=1 Tax=Vitis vinifera TaxID=29760 RepID=A0A438CEX9_VITVI|nr:Retrovirus-related Pol polyprotein from transposon TNT 1-94 [Vitis vinifera]